MSPFLIDFKLFNFKFVIYYETTIPRACTAFLILNSITLTAAEEEKKVKVIEEDVTIKAKICADDLAKAEPALMAAQEALNTLNKNNLTELKSFGSPPDLVVNVCAAVLVLFAKKGKIPKDRSWKACKVNYLSL